MWAEKKRAFHTEKEACRRTKYGPFEEVKTKCPSIKSVEAINHMKTGEFNRCHIIFTQVHYIKLLELPFTNAMKC